MRKLTQAFFCCALGALMVQTARAEYITSYTVTLDLGQPVTNIMMLEEAPGIFGSMTWAFSADGTGTTTLTNPFPFDPAPTESLLVGIVQGLATDPNPEQKHVVLFMNDNAATLSNNIAWGTLFQNTLEEDLIAAIELSTSGQDWPIIQPGLDFVASFGEGDAKHGILGPGGFEQSAWFTLGDTFSVMTWSTGTLVGTGTSEITFVPEPAGLCAMLLLARRRR